MKFAMLGLGLAIMSSCGTTPKDDSQFFTLYRTSVASEDGDSMRIHVATFDTADGEKYNRENCEIASQLFQQQPGVRTRLWCEKGRYRK